LQSLNEELTALNTQLQETLERQRTTSNDLQNVLYSTDVATLFLDSDLNIRFFTPATRSLFSVIPSDVGRPLADLSSLAADGALLSDARAVLRTLSPIEREVEADTGAWYIRRIMPYRTQDDRIEGVVITFVDISERKRAADTQREAIRQAELASLAKSRFLAVASHDLRQPLQSLSLLQGMLAKMVEGERAQTLVARLDKTLRGMAGMLNTLLDINRIKTGTVRPDVVDFPIGDVLDRLRDELIYHAEARSLALRVLPCRLSVHSDPQLLEHMLRNLLSNALKYTPHGKVLVGCRRREGRLCIETWDTGIGIPEKDFQTIFEEYHQLAADGTERSAGLGLGLSIVQRLGDILGHRISVRSRLGKGSVFSIEVMLAASGTVPLVGHHPLRVDERTADTGRRAGTILVVEDDPEVRELFALFLADERYDVITAPDSVAALNLVTRGSVRPDVILADHNLSNGMNGLQLTTHLREKLHREIPAIILTGDILTGSLGEIALKGCVALNKPVQLKEITDAIQRLLAAPLAVPAMGAGGEADPAGGPPVIFVVDDDSHVRDTLRSVLEEDGRTVEDYAACEEFLDAYRPGREACLLIDAYLPGMKGIELLQRLRDDGHRLPAIMITGNSDVQIAVQAMKAGASDFIEKPISRRELLDSVERALELSRDASKLLAGQATAASQIASLTRRQHQILEQVLAGKPSKNIAADLGISQRTVESHRSSIMKKTGSKSLPALARLAITAASNGGKDPRA
jgi:two-component system CheB/CheR fusion protein